MEQQAKNFEKLTESERLLKGVDLYQEHILKLLLILIWVLALIHMSAEYYFLYWTLRWLDIVTHFLGGVWVGIAAIWVWFFSGYVRMPRLPSHKALVMVLITGLTVGILWELYEYSIWQWSGEGLPRNYIPDTVLDIIMDVLGAAVGFGIVTYILTDMTHEKGTPSS